MTKNSRAHYRITYPVGVRPKFLAEEKEFAVLEVSEQGIRIEVDKDLRLDSDIVDGKIVFFDQETFEIQGRVLRKTAAYWVIVFPEGCVPLRKVISEQRFLLQRFGTLLSSS